MTTLEVVGMESPDSCQIEGCANRATLSPVLECFAPIVRPHPPLKLYLGIRFCADHALPNAESVLSDPIWDVVCKMARASGKMVPKRARTRVKYLSLAEHARQFPPPSKVGGH